jgi:transposase
MEIMFGHWSRDFLMRQRTMLVNAIRANMAEFGMIAAEQMFGERRAGGFNIRSETSRLPFR